MKPSRRLHSRLPGNCWARTKFHKNRKTCMAYNLLKGKKGIIFGALDHKSIAWKVAEKAFDEGAVITLSNTPVAIRFGEITELSEQCKAPLIPADATNVGDLEKVFAQSMEVFGGKLD